MSGLMSLDDALARVLALAEPLGSETVPLADADGRVLAAPLKAAHNQPPFDASAMDGYAMRSADVMPGRPLILVGTAQAGKRFAGLVGAGQCVRVFTGAPMPIGADAVIIQEEAIAHGNRIAFDFTPMPGAYVRKRGYDFADGGTLLPAGTILTPAALMLAAAANVRMVTVARRPAVALLASGDELVAPGTPLGPDQIVAANAYGLAPLIAPWARSISDLGIAADDPQAIEQALLAAFDARADVVVTTGGASVGDHDHMQAVLRQLGVELDLWRIAIRPGKPVMVGRRGSTLIFGLPGNPVSALVSATLLLLPALRAISGATNPVGARLRLPLYSSLPPNGDRRHFVRATLLNSASGTMVEPLAENDSGHTSSIAAADVLIVQPEHDPGMPAGEIVDVVPLRPF